MKKTRLAALSMALLGFYTAIAQMPNGAYKAIETQYGDTKQSKEELSKQSIIKIFKDGYWIAASFGDSAQGFLGSGGGTYKIVNGKYVEKVDFFSWDTTAVGKTYMFDYSLNNEEYSQDGYVNSEKFVNMPIKEKYTKLTPAEALKNTALEGVWKLDMGEWGTTKAGEGDLVGVTMLKFYSYPRFAVAWYNPRTKSFVGAGGGTYQFDGEKLIEKVEYSSWGKPEFPEAEFKVTVGKDKYSQTGWDDKLKETWKRVK